MILNIFDIRNNIKKTLEKSKSKVFFKERDVLFIKMGKNVGFEQDGKGEKFIRPVIIIKKFNDNSFRGVSLTTKLKKGKYYFSFYLKGRKQTAIISQVRLYDKKRLVSKIGMMPGKGLS